MTIGVYRFQWAPTQTTVFRGFIKEYDKNRVLTGNCKQIRNTKSEALQDARKLKKNYEQI